MNPERVRQECVGAAMIVECVEHDLDRVVVEDVLATRKPGADFIWFRVKADEDDIEVVPVIAEVHVSWLRTRGPRPRLALLEAGNVSEPFLPSRRGPHRLREVL